MEEATRATRRTVLRHGLFAIGALAGFAGLTGIAEKARSAALPSAQATVTQTVRLYGSEWHLAAPGLRRGDLPKRGDVVTVSGILHESLGQAQVGTFLSTVIHLDTPSGHGPYAPAQMETHTFQLREGTLVGIGTTNADGDSTFSIVGGTGRFLGVTGSYTGKQSPLETGGDGTAEFTLTFNTGR